MVLDSDEEGEGLEITEDAAAASSDTEVRVQNFDFMGVWKRKMLGCRLLLLARSRP